MNANRLVNLVPALVAFACVLMPLNALAAGGSFDELPADGTCRDAQGRYYPWSQGLRVQDKEACQALCQGPCLGFGYSHTTGHCQLFAEELGELDGRVNARGSGAHGDIVAVSGHADWSCYVPRTAAPDLLTELGRLQGLLERTRGETADARLTRLESNQMLRCAACAPIESGITA